MATSDGRDRERTIDFLVKMYLEQGTFARHHETQRSAVTTIFTSLAVLLLGAIGTLWQSRGDIDERFIPFTLGLLLLGVMGFAIVRKLFERSMLHFSLSEAYRNTVETILKDDAVTAIAGRTGEIVYVRNALADAQERGEKLDLSTIAFPAGQKRTKPIELDTFRETIKTHNPIDPREIVVPLHDSATRRLSWASLRTLWGAIYLGFTVIGAVLTLVALR